MLRTSTKCRLGADRQGLPLPALALALGLALGIAPATRAGEPDDLVVARIDALLALPSVGLPFGLPVAAGGAPTFAVSTGHSGRCVTDVGDVTGDGAPDLAVGYDVATGSTQHPALEVLDGRSGARVWAARAGVGFRSLHGLSARDGKLVGAAEAMDGRVTCRATDDGAVLWSVALAPGQRVTFHATRFVDDLSGDGVPDVAVAAGRHLDAALLLSGADGATLWSHPAGDAVYDILLGARHDGDALRDLVVVGGDTTPFARVLSGADGSVLAARSLPGPGSVLLAADDLDANGDTDLFVGLFAAPAPCLLALDGRSLDTLWEAVSQVHDVTSLAPLGDVNDTGLSDFAVGSFDNALSAYLALNGAQMWRREVSTFNTGAVLSVAAMGDLDGNGYGDVAGVSFDSQVYLVGGRIGQFLAAQRMGGKQVVVARLGDGDGDGRDELAVASDRRVVVLDGSLGLCDGPDLFVAPPDSGGECQIDVFSYPTTALYMFYSRGTGSLSLPGFEGSFGLDVPGLILHFAGTAPGAGIAGFIVGPFPDVGVPVELYFQAVTVYPSGQGKFSNVESTIFGR